jgi:hypothetical protein
MSALSMCSTPESALLIDELAYPHVDLISHRPESIHALFL